MSKELEISKQYGVPTYETSKELDWREDTTFYWVTLPNKNRCLATKTTPPKSLTRGFAGYFVLVGLDEDILPNNYDPSSFSEIIPAPQMHEISSKMPNEIEHDREHYRVIYRQHGGSLYCLLEETDGDPNYQYEDNEITPFVNDFLLEGVGAYENWYAEVLANMYLRLKAEGLLKANL